MEPNNPPLGDNLSICPTNYYKNLYRSELSCGTQQSRPLCEIIFLHICPTNCKQSIQVGVSKSNPIIPYRKPPPHGLHVMIICLFFPSLEVPESLEILLLGSELACETLQSSLGNPLPTDCMLTIICLFVHCLDSHKSRETPL